MLFLEENAVFLDEEIHNDVCYDCAHSEEPGCFPLVVNDDKEERTNDCDGSDDEMGRVMIGDEGVSWDEVGHVVEAEECIRDDAEKQADEEEEEPFVLFFFTLEGGFEGVPPDEV